jgi:hypothetical protein
MAQYKVYDDNYDGTGEEEEYGKHGEHGSARARSYQVVIILLAVILVAVSGLYFYQSSQLKADFAIERDTLTGRILAIRRDLAGMKTSNDSLNVSIIMERGRTDSVLDALARERSTTRATIRKYEAALGAMRTAAAGFAYTIDSLNKVNTRLISENLGMRSEIKSERLRADAAEERADEADLKIRIGQRILARDIRLVPTNEKDREVTRVSRAHRLRIDFTLSANNLADPGLRSAWVCVTGPDGYVMANAQEATFLFEGEGLIYSATREVDYQNSDLDVSIYYDGTYILAGGTYKVDIYVDGMLAGSSEVLLR